MLKKLWEVIKSILFVVVIVFVLTNWVFIPVTVQGNSMYPTLKDQSRGISFLWNKKDIDRFDIVVLNTDQGYIVKRVIALENETLEVKNNQLYINDTLVEEPFLHTQYKYSFPVFTQDVPKTKVEPGMIYVMGDNRPHSLDSRHVRFKSFSIDQVVSKGILIFFPFDQFQLIGY